MIYKPASRYLLNCFVRGETRLPSIMILRGEHIQLADIVPVNSVDFPWFTLIDMVSNWGYQLTLYYMHSINENGRPGNWDLLKYYNKLMGMM